jgi:PAS domain S-box-containing protein
MLTGLASEQVGVEAMRSGAHDYLLKDHINADSLHASVIRATEKIGLIKALRQKHAEAEAERRAIAFLADSVPHLIWTNTPEGRIDYANRRWREYTALETPSSLATVEKLIHPEDRASYQQDWQQALAQGKMFESERRIQQASDGKWHTFLVRTVPMLDGAGNVIRCFGSLTNIEELKRSKQHLEASLAEKEVLLKEVHHRVKNNLQVIASLLRLQSEALPDGRMADVVRESQRRVESMALIHEQLYESGDLRSIDLAAYTDVLAQNLFRAYGDPARIRLRVVIQHAELAIDEAIPCGLILNELISDAFKHAFPADKAGEVAITGQLDAGDQVRIEVRDTGVGIPESVDFRKPKSLGLEIVNILTRQLNGKLELERGSGTLFRLTFPRGGPVRRAARHGTGPSI